MAVSLSDVVTYKRLVAAGNDELWYEDLDVAAGTMTELSAANGDIDTSDQLNMFEAYQKVFIVNGANLKVADFINTKLTLSALTSPPAHGDILTQDQGSSNFAYMVVDFVNTAKTAIYGYAYYGGSATAFDISNTVSSNNATATMDGSTFTPSVVTASPHWYDWTDYPDVVLTVGGATKSYGALPNKAYLGVLYRGRTILSGDPEHPEQWYMARQAFPWDFAYVAGDAGTPVKGGNADAGELGDIIRCLISYKDDYLIFGCATSIWYMSGDPAYGGELGGLDLTTGIFGANSWCWDGAGNLYFWGTNGFYKTTIPGTPVCLSAIALPDLVKDEDADSSTHRITMAYDRRDYGINICITKLSDGSNSNYWYDLKTEGFFPETYPDECGPYSLFYYPANDPGLRDLLVGCKDGYIRKFDKTAEDDNIGGSNQAIDSYAVLGPIQLSGNINDGTLSNVNIISAGGLSGGSESDSDDVNYSIFAARTSENVIEAVEASPATPKYSGTFSSPGYQKGNKDRRKIRGRFGAIKIGNDTATETWGFEKLTLDVKQIGRVL
ncbi:hypothetical protein LCGC14_0447880 [marine sediment metagenome]|uniref:Uncharacterized protein n=1 Tax=marine sediment metagenome TaxID=412755 RepID=A0A0F9VSS1_9ZZZZ